jgi:type I restriction enzyme R subunit
VKGFTRIGAIADGVDAVYTSDETKRRFEILVRQVFIRFKALVMEPSAFTYAERHDNLEAIYKKLEERRDTADVSDLLKELHRIVNEAVRAAKPGDDQAESKLFDLSHIDLAKLQEEFAKKAKRKATVIEDIRQIVERKLAKLVDLANNLDVEQRRAAEEGLSEEELALFDLLKKPEMTKVDREGADPGRSGGLHPRPPLRSPTDAAVHRRRQTSRCEARVRTYLAAKRPSTLRGRPRRASRCGSVADGLTAEDAENATEPRRKGRLFDVTSAFATSPFVLAALLFGLLGIILVTSGLVALLRMRPLRFAL